MYKFIFMIMMIFSIIMTFNSYNLNKYNYFYSYNFLMKILLK